MKNHFLTNERKNYSQHGRLLSLVCLGIGLRWAQLSEPLCFSSNPLKIHQRKSVPIYQAGFSPVLQSLFLISKAFLNSRSLSFVQHRQRRSLLVTSSDEWTTLGTNPLLTPSQPSWMVMSPDRTRAKISRVSSVKACSTLMASRAEVST